MAWRPWDTYDIFSFKKGRQRKRFLIFHSPGGLMPLFPIKYNTRYLKNKFQQSARGHRNRLIFHSLNKFGPYSFHPVIVGIISFKI